MHLSRCFRWAAYIAFSVWLIPARADDRVNINAKINGVAVHLIFDTGGGIDMVLGQRTAERLGLKLIPFPRGSKPPPGANVRYAGLTNPCRVEIFGKAFANVRLSILDPQSEGFPGFPMDCDGIVGWPAVHQEVLILNLASDQISSLPRVPPKALDWVKLRVLSDRNQLCLYDTSGGGKPKGVMIDTGDEDGVSLAPHEWERWKAANPKRPKTLVAYFMPGAGLVVAEMSWADKVWVGGLLLTNVPVQEANTAQTNWGLVQPDFEASLGLAALRRVDLVIDGKGAIAYAEPRRDRPAAFRHNRIGAVFVPNDLSSHPLVAHVIDGGPAFKGGIRDGDVLLRIDSLDVARWWAQPGSISLHPFFEQPAGTRLSLTVQRGTMILKATVVLENILGPP